MACIVYNMAVCSILYGEYRTTVCRGMVYRMAGVEDVKVVRGDFRETHRHRLRMSSHSTPDVPRYSFLAFRRRLFPMGAAGHMQHLAETCPYPHVHRHVHMRL